MKLETVKAKARKAREAILGKKYVRGRLSAVIIAIDEKSTAATFELKGDTALITVALEDALTRLYRAGAVPSPDFGITVLAAGLKSVGVDIMGEMAEEARKLEKEGAA
jgi:hypothetical protein